MRLMITFMTIMRAVNETMMIFSMIYLSRQKILTSILPGPSPQWRGVAEYRQWAKTRQSWKARQHLDLQVILIVIMIYMIVARLEWSWLSYSRWLKVWYKRPGSVGRPDEDDGFDDQYFRRRPKSFCLERGRWVFIVMLGIGNGNGDQICLDFSV